MIIPIREKDIAIVLVKSVDKNNQKILRINIFFTKLKCKC